MSKTEFGHLYRACMRAFGNVFEITKKGNVRAGGRLYCYSFETGRFYDIEKRTAFAGSGERLYGRRLL